MKSLVGLLALLAALCSCTPAEMSPGAKQGDEFASALERYGNLDQDGASYAFALTGSALAAAIKAQELLDSLGFKRLGAANFEVVSSSQTTATACMDLSEVVIINEAGLPTSTVSGREAVFVELESGLISRFEPLGERC